MLTHFVATAMLIGCGPEDEVVKPAPLAAFFDYSVPGRFSVPDPPSPEGQYEIYVDGPLHPGRWPVQLDACASTGGIEEYRWTIEGTPMRTTTRCDDFAYDFPAEGSYTVSLVVVDDEGNEDSHTAEVVVKDLLIFGVGDSYASGEGNPDTRVSFGAAGAVAAPTPSSPVWQNRRCHRSAHSGQVRAAQRLEDADPHTSVSFVHLACSGARVHAGLLEDYPGVEVNDPPLPDFPPQIDRVAELADGHEIDALMVSIGGNDVNFSDIIKACVLGENCHLSPVDVDPAFEQQVTVICELTGTYEDDCLDYFESFSQEPEALDATTIFEEHSINAGVDEGRDGIDDLPENYRDLAARISGQLGMDPGRVFLTEIPDVARNAQAQFCGWDTASTISALLLQLPGVTLAEFTWASTYVAAELQAAMQAAADEHGWQLVSGIAARYLRHGYCSVDGWLVRLHDTFLIQGDEFGAMHPNEAGHGTYAEAIADAIAP